MTRIRQQLAFQQFDELFTYNRKELGLNVPCKIGSLAAYAQGIQVCSVKHISSCTQTL